LPKDKEEKKKKGIDCGIQEQEDAKRSNVLSAGGAKEEKAIGSTTWLEKGGGGEKKERAAEQSLDEA